LKTIIIFLGDPIACTGIISRSGVEDLGLRKEVEETLVNKIKGAQIFSHNHELLQVRKSETVAYVVDRGEFDRVLAREAVEAGVELKLSTRMIDMCFFIWFYSNVRFYFFKYPYRWDDLD